MAISSGYSAEDLARLGPDALTRRRMLAEALLAKSAGQRKIEHPLQGAAQMAEALVNGLRVRKLDQAETTGIKSGESAWESLFGGSSGASSTAETAPVTMPGAAAEMSGTSPGRISPSGSTGIQISSSPDATELNALLGDPAKRSGLPAGMRNNNPGNIKFVGQKVPGIVGPSVNTDQGDPQAVFDTPESGMQAMYSLLNKKYSGGKVTPNQIIAGNMGWTPGNYDAARNVARSMGIGPDDDIGFSDPARAAKFMRGLILQEHGKSGGLYPESMILSAIGGRAPNQVASLDPAIGMPPQATPPQMPPAASVYVDPMVSAPNAQPQQMAAIPPAGGMPPLEAPRTIGTPPVPPNAPPPQQLAQALTGNSAAPQQQGPSVQDLAKILSNPWVSDEKKKVAQILLGKKMEENDPVRKMQLEKGQLEIERLRNPDADFITGRDGAIFKADKRAGTVQQVYGGKPEKFRTLTDDEERQMGLDPSKAYQIGSDDKVQQIGGGGTTVNIDQKAEGAFDKKLAEKQAETFDTMATEGMNARADLSVIGELEGLLQGQGGTLTGISAALAKYGIGGEGIDDLQAANALINKLVPTQRAPGSGSMSDRDVEMFRSSLPSLWNSPGGNEKIINVMKGLSQYKQAQGEIADEVLMGDMSRQEARRALRNLPNPLEEFRKGSGGPATGPKAAPSGEPDFSKMSDEELQRYIDGK